MQRRQATVDRYFAAVAALDADAFVACFAPDGVSYDPVGTRLSEGPDGLCRFVAGITRTFREMVAYWDPQELFAQLEAE